MLKLNKHKVKEFWKNIPNHEGYEASNLGRIRSKKRYVKNGDDSYRLINDKILKPYMGNKNLYTSVSIRCNGLRKTKRVHQLIAITFLKKQNIDDVINHKNFDRTDNRLCNLEYISTRKNTNKKHLKSSSKYVGVCFMKDKNKWASYITHLKRNIHLGFYETEIKAFDARKKYMIKNNLYV